MIVKSKRAIKSTLRSCTFLASFIAIIWASICLSRNTLNKFDEPRGIILASFLCGFSILLESKNRQKQLALYCIPKALESFCTIHFSERCNPIKMAWVQYLMFGSSFSLMVTKYYSREPMPSFVRSVFRYFLE
jgi:hypothetical protein